MHVRRYSRQRLATPSTGEGPHELSRRRLGSVPKHCDVLMQHGGGGGSQNQPPCDHISLAIWADPLDTM
jgi:hypothetical protein